MTQKKGKDSGLVINVKLGMKGTFRLKVEDDKTRCGVVTKIENGEVTFTNKGGKRVEKFVIPLYEFPIKMISLEEIKKTK